MSAATVLVVDDSPENRYVVRRVLERAGFAVAEAATGEEGLRRALDDPDLVVLDVNLPDMHGFDVCQRLKTERRTAHVPVMHLSQTSVSDSARAAGLDSGADAYLTEPVDPEVLVATTRALLRVRWAEDRLRRERADAELLSGLTMLLGDALTVDQVLTTVVRHASRDLGDCDVSVYLDTGRGNRLRLALTTLGDAVASELLTLSAHADIPAAVVSRTGRPMFGDANTLMPSHPHLGADLQRRGRGDWGAIPLVSYGRRIGVLVIAFVQERRISAEDQALLLAWGERCGQALERARLYEQQRQIATTLQASLLPAQLPRVPGARLAARYEAGTATMDVGGDFYDVFARPDDWIAVIGDVCGRGAEAAALTSLARHTIRAEAQHHALPSEILSALHAAILSAHPPGEMRFVTAVCVRMAPDGHGGLILTAAVAGHPSPLVLTADGFLGSLAQTGPLLGAFRTIAITDTVTRLRPGDTLMLYTDGVTEARRGAELYGDDRLRRLVRHLARRHPTATLLTDTVVDAAQDFGEGAEDDIAVLTVEVLDAEGAG